MLTRLLADLHYRKVHLPRVQRIANALAAQLGPRRSVLDVGCGDGRLARCLAERIGAKRVCGVDILVQPAAVIDVVGYDGERIPHDDRSFDVVLLSDVLHHAQSPVELLRECLRVAGSAVAVKDHLKFGPWSAAVLLAMDQIGNAASGVRVRGTYFSLPQWFDLVAQAGGRIRTLRWPLRIHDLPWRLVTRSDYQFTALVEPAVG